MNSKSQSQPPVVFVSYSHDSPAHAREVRSLADRLRQIAGCDARIDQYVETRVSNWPRWMREELVGADFVLMVFTRTYRRRFDGRERRGQGLGVSWEGTVITNQLYAGGGTSLKFIPVVRRESDLRFVPQDVFSGTAYLLDRDWSRLVAKLWAESPAPPPIGSPPARSTTAATLRKTARARAASREGDTLRTQPFQLSVLFVGAQRGTGLDLRHQLRQTHAAIERGKLASRVCLSGVFNLTPDQLLMRLGSSTPDVLHLSGKQEGGLIKLHDKTGKLIPVSADRLAEALLRFKDSLRLVILDTCYSLQQARLLTREIHCAIGVERAIAEPVAIDFFSMFFNSLASGRSIQDSYDIAHSLELSKIEGNPRYRRELEGILEEPFHARSHLPQLVFRKGINPRQLLLV